MENNLTIKELVKSEGWVKFTKRLELYSIILLGITILAYFLRDVVHLNYMLFLTFTATSFAVLCFFMAFKDFESSSGLMSLLFYRIYGFGLSVGFVTIMFILNRWPGSIMIMSSVSVALISISLVLGIIEISGENKNKIGIMYFVRIALALIPLGYLFISGSIKY